MNIDEVLLRGLRRVFTQAFPISVATFAIDAFFTQRYISTNNVIKIPKNIEFDAFSVFLATFFNFTSVHFTSNILLQDP